MLEALRENLAQRLTNYRVAMFEDDYRGLSRQFSEDTFYGRVGFKQMTDKDLLQAYVEMLGDAEEAPPPGVNEHFLIVDEAALIAHLTAEAVGERLATEE